MGAGRSDAGSFAALALPSSRDGPNVVNRRSLGCLALLALVSHAGTVHAGVIRGIIHGASVAPSVPSASAYPGMAGSMPGMHTAVHGLAEDAVVYVDHIPAATDSAFTPLGPHPRLAQQGQMFQPRVLAVVVGTAVDFPNLDPIYHNVFSLSPTKRFDLGKYSRGHFKTVVFDHVGLVNVFCDIHSDMEAFVLVLPHRAFTRPDSAGHFELPDLPAGHYQLHVWHPDRTESVRPVDLGPGKDVEFEITL
jgi:hypothetical protein